MTVANHVYNQYNSNNNSAGIIHVVSQRISLWTKFWSQVIICCIGTISCLVLPSYLTIEMNTVRSSEQKSKII